MKALAQAKTENWSNWIEIKESYKESSKKINKFIQNKNIIPNKNIHDVVDLEIAREMKRDLTKTTKNLERKVLYEFNAFSLEDIKNSKLTKREVEILEYRVKNHYTFEKISVILNTKQSSIFKSYTSAKEKIERYRRMNVKEKKLSKLSPQQNRIHELLKKNKTNREIAHEINTTIDNVKKQKKKIKEKLGGTKKGE
ncbi:hypothetical protein [Maledivibacter halophilus]|uniref:Uncharacterized protein n=1 Tax=Maledivibacter halophilus TaxID=36842 RepID=A0A1T5MGB0_9FIRM|nr:hypothetical protein [Maledivibacter halophilus]SKC86899.1 hypothetical protein SAMN02194393_04593 [Maledivibacter halophilus]